MRQCQGIKILSFYKRHNLIKVLYKLWRTKPTNFHRMEVGVFFFNDSRIK